MTQAMRQWLVIGACLSLAAGAGGAQGDSPQPWEQPGEAGQQILGPDGAPLLWVPAGQFIMGSTNEGIRYRIIQLHAIGGIADEQPAHEVILDGFWLQKLEVTNAQYARFLNERGTNQDDEGQPLLDISDENCQIVEDNGVYKVAPGREEHPVGEVTWYGAKGYAEHYGMAVPTEAQWEYAARGPQRPRYPWGDEWQRDNLCWRGHIAESPTPFAATFPVGSFAAGASWCGALDMAGNASEWCADWYDPDYYRHAPTENPAGPPTPPVPHAQATRVCRGGSYFEYGDECRSAKRLHFPPGECHDYHGFRCVANCE